jgi:signal transduction histidine kinase
VAAATLLTRFLAGLGDSGIAPLFFAAVLLSAWYGGMGPGLLATLLSGIATAWLLTAHSGFSVPALASHLLRLTIFTAVAVITSSLHAAMRRAADESRRAREAAESASAAKSRFLAMVSHELRTPLSPVLMVAEMLERDPTLPPAMLPDIQTIRRNVDLEIRLIEDLVDLTRIQVGKMRLDRARLDIHVPLKAAIEVCAATRAEKNIELTTAFMTDPAWVNGDTVRLQQVFWNLLRNAIKFTPQGGQICIRTWQEPKGRIAIEMRDTGIGIEPQQLSKIFEAFEQGDSEIQVRFGGLGLGLAICQALVEAHHGSITAASEGKGRGATFTVLLSADRVV